MKKVSFLLFFASVLLQSCTVFYNPILVENDIVLGKKRVSLELSFINNNWRSQSYVQTLTFLKETGRDNITHYTMYDVIQLSSQSFDLEEQMYMLIDNEVVELQTVFENHQKNQQLNQKSTEILLADSTKQSVVTGYDVLNKKTIQMKHLLDEEHVDKMLKANIISLQYYTGPSMLKSDISGADLHRLKEWITK